MPKAIMSARQRDKTDPAAARRVPARKIYRIVGRDEPKIRLASDHWYHHLLFTTGSMILIFFMCTLGRAGA
jgi:hypothetical protein